jgi:hypothetical protein
VVDDPADAPAVIADLVAAGIPEDDIALLRGTAGTERIDPSGAGGGIGGRLSRILAFTLVDQIPDLLLYDAALRDGRAVLAIRVPSDPLKATAHRILREHGAHFINHYGRFATEELDLWRGPEPDIPDVLRR